MSPTTRRVAGGLVIVLLLGLGVWSFWPGASEPVDPRHATAALPAPSPPIRTQAVPGPRKAVAAPAAASVADDDLHVAALEILADATGGTVIQCRLPADSPAGIPRGLPRADRRGDVVSALVDEADGRALLQRVALPFPGEDADEATIAAHVDRANAPPFGTAVWERGICRVEPVQTVVIPGRVVWLEEPVQITVNGCGGSWPVDVDGRFEMETVAGPPCTLEVGSSNMGDGHPVDRWNPPTEIVVEQTENPTMVERLSELRAELDRLQQMADPLAVALEDPELTPEIRERFQAWQAEDNAEREQIITGLTRSIAFFEKLED